MANYTEGTQVPFGDGSHVPPLELPEELESDTTTLTVMQNIFLACDKSNSDSAQVSDLINFINPHLQENSSQLKILKVALDPNDTNPYINSETFFKIMKKWKESIEAPGDDSAVRELQNAGNESQNSSSFSKSSGVLKGCLESDSRSLNLSNSSTCSLMGNNGIDVSLLQERINELEHRNRKLTTDLEHSRAQLTTSEDQNESLQGDVQKLSRRLLSVQQENSELEKDQQNSEELKEILSTTKKHLCKVEKDFISSEKQVYKLKQQIHNLEIEHRKLEDKTDQLVKRDAASKQLIQKLQSELQIKEQEYSSLEDICTQANTRLNEQKQLVLHYQDVNKSLKEDKIKMEKHFCEVMKNRMSSSHIKLSRTSSDSSVSSKSGTFTNPTNLIPEKESQKKSASFNTHPIYKDRQYNKPLTTLFRNKGFIYNSPRTLHMVQNPVSPPLDNSATISSSACIKSVDSDDSPQFTCATCEMSPVFTYTSSTPQQSKTLLDMTPPSVIKRLPLLLPTKRPPSMKKDRQLFRQYRFVGSSSEDEEADSKTEQQLDVNLNNISQELNEALCLGCAAEKERKSSLPTMYVIEHSCGRIRSTSDSSSGPNSLRNIADSSYEGDPLLWKSSQKVSPHESLESEIAQAKLVDNEKAELRNRVEQLQAENIRLQNNAERVKIYSPERREHYYESEYKTLKNKIQELESDNNQKYMKIVDFMEEIEKLKKELKRISGKDMDEIKKLQQNISELHYEKKGILHDLQQQKFEKQNFDSFIANVQSIKDSCDSLQTVLQHSKQNGEELYTELEKISADKLGLRVDIDNLKKCIFKVNDKNKTLYTQLQNLSEEYFKFKKTIKLRNLEHSSLRRPQDYSTPTFIKQDPQEASPAQNEDTLEVACKEQEKTLYLLQEESKTLKIIISEHESTILLLNKNITDNKTEIGLLKQNIAQQTEKLEEQKCENKKLGESNKALTQDMNETIKSLDFAQKENEYLAVRISNLEVENKSVLADCKYIKDFNNKLIAEKETLGRRCEQLRNDYEKMKQLKEDIEHQFEEMKNTITDLKTPKKYSPQGEESKPLIAKRKYEEETQDHTRHTEALTTLQRKIDGLEIINKKLQSENEILQEEFKKIKNSYEIIIGEKKMWGSEKNEWLQLRDELSQKLTEAMSDSKLLEEQLHSIQHVSMESLQKSNSNISCNNCLKLAVKISDLNTKLNESQKQNNKLTQSRKYDRMLTTIEKLKAKSFGAEEELKNEKDKIANLVLENAQLKADIDQNKKTYIQETKALEIKYSRLQNEAEVFAKLENEFKKLQRQVQEISQEKNLVLQENGSLKDKLEILLKEKDNRVKSINKETNQLKIEIQELVKQKSKLEKKLATAENLLKCKPNIDKTNKENSQLKQEIQEAKKQMDDLEMKLKKAEQELQQNLHAEQKLKEFQQSTSEEKLNMRKEIEDLKKKLDKSLSDLQKSEARNLSIRKKVIDEQAASVPDAHGHKNLVDENLNLQKQVKNYENELTEIRFKLSEASTCFQSLCGYVVDVNQQLYEKRMHLYRATLTAVVNWRNTFENEPENKTVLEIFDKEEPPAPQQTVVTPLDEEMYKLKHQIEVTSLILDTLGKWKIPDLSLSSTTEESQSSTRTPQKSVTGTISKTKIVSRTLTPYHATREQTTTTTRFRSKTTAPPNSEALPAKPVFVRSNSPTRHLQSRDSSPLRSKRSSGLPTQSRDSSPNKSKNYDSADNTRTSRIETDLVCYNFEEEDDNMLSKDEEVELGLGSIENTPSLSSSTLESLGLLYDGDSPSWSKKEIEEKFHILVTCFMMDVVTIKERSKKQQTLQSKIENKFTLETEKIITILNNARQLKRDHQIKGLLTTSLGHIKKMTRMFSLTSTLAVQSGALQHEQHSLRIINVMINHAANLRQVLQNASPRYKYIGPREKKSTEGSHSSTVKVSSIFEPPVMINEVEEIGNMDVQEIGNMNQHLSSSGSSEDERKTEDNSSTVSDLTQNNLLFYALLFCALLVIAIFFLSGIAISRNPSECHSLWSEILSPFVKRTDPKVPFPT